MPYFAIRSMKAKDENGNVRQYQPGEKIPAESWANPGLWVKREWIRAEDIEPAYDRSKLQPARPSTPEDAARSISKVPEHGKPLPGHEAEPEAKVEAEPETEAAAESESGIDREQLMSLTRDQLNALAEGEGVEARMLANKGDVADAILEKAGIS